MNSMELDTSTTTTQLLDQVNSMTDMLPAVMIGVAGLSVIALLLTIVSARSHHKQRRAILQTAEDTHAIRELLERRFGPSALNPAPRPEALKDDPQLPPRP